MDTCEVLIVGGGPAGSACAWRLRRAGVDVAVVDKAAFPRDKVCAGWITPPVVADLQIDPADYGTGRTFQPITGFRIGLIGAAGGVAIAYPRAVSFAIRRCEFDDYLLRRSGARLRLGEEVVDVRRHGSRWIVNGAIAASMIVGAGGHWCPVARAANDARRRLPLVVAQEAEFPIDPASSRAFAVDPEKPELYFTPALDGYGWCFRKGGYVNVGFGHARTHGLPGAAAAFLDFLKARGTIPASTPWRWRGHAYRLAGPRPRDVVHEGMLLVGDAAGLAHPMSGEGIRPAIESGLLAASTIIAANGRYTVDRLLPYGRGIRDRFGVRPLMRMVARAVPARASAFAASRLLSSRWFVRHVLLDRWFLRTDEVTIAS